MRGRYRGWEVPVLVLGFAVELVGLFLVVVRDQAWGWTMILTGIAVVFVIERRVKMRADAAARRKRPHWNEELHYRDGQ